MEERFNRSAQTVKRVLTQDQFADLLQIQEMIQNCRFVYVNATKPRLEYVKGEGITVYIPNTQANTAKTDITNLTARVVKLEAFYEQIIDPNRG